MCDFFCCWGCDVPHPSPRLLGILVIGYSSRCHFGPRQSRGSAHFREVHRILRMNSSNYTASSSSPSLPHHPNLGWPPSRRRHKPSCQAVNARAMCVAIAMVHARDARHPAAPPSAPACKARSRARRGRARRPASWRTPRARSALGTR